MKFTPEQLARLSKILLVVSNKAYAKNEVKTLQAVEKMIQSEMSKHNNGLVTEMNKRFSLPGYK